uniref:Myosin motor domain-containing protein n=1 Tax=Strigamia maritima TaxID=126957 RepID=T1J6G9_STRMM
MENALHGRDRAGIQDFVLLEDYQSENAFIENLKKRFKENLIYTYIGPVLISVNPYKNLDVYSKQYVTQYQNVNLFELPPHIFAITDSAFRSMRDEFCDHCILISGESGSGKTEASKKILQYLAAASHNLPNVELVKDKLLQSNPVLEAFGNAKTNRNDNSSRFGKYMDIEFNFLGAPVGGHILNYLLEKSRVVYQADKERNFHIFYQLLAGAEDSLLEKLYLRRDPNYYYYLNQGESSEVTSVDDVTNFQAVRQALSVIEFNEKETQNLFAIIASVLHLGNTGFMEDNGKATVAQTKPAQAICKLLGCPENVLLEGLINRTIEARGDIVQTPLSRDQAIYARDALAKAIYERLFSWLVGKLNKALAYKEKTKKTLMGILDIYGFEIFQNNSFEQFCINYCNEKLQQLFIELTLKSEQEEYSKEGIEWEPVEYFNNKIICDLVEEKHKGIIAVLDEECLRPGDATDTTFLEKLERTVGGHEHFMTHKLLDNKMRKTLQRNEFRLLHYAGDVTYQVDGFLDKNNDLLYRDLKTAMAQTTNDILLNIFPLKEIQNKRRPDTIATQFKSSLLQLMDILMSKEPSYVRCIKPNDFKRSGNFDDKIVGHQVKYLGLMENVRVRRAGFAYRRRYEVFLKRYKSLCPATWPNFRGTAKQGVAALVSYLNYERDEFRMGRTKIFIRFPRTLFQTEDAFQRRKHDLATIIQALWRGYIQKKRFLIIREAVTAISKHWKGYTARNLLVRRRWAAFVVRSFIKGFITRNGPLTEYNQQFVQCVKAEYLRRLSRELPINVLDKSWPKPPKICEEASELLRDIYTIDMARRYCRNISSDRKNQMEEKVIAESLFKTKKQSYLASVPKLFRTNRLNSEEKLIFDGAFEKGVKPLDEKTLYSCPVTKYDRHGYKPRERILVLTNTALYILEAKDCKLKHRLTYNNISGLSVTQLNDGLLIIRIPNDLKRDKDENTKDLKGDMGDLILSCDSLIEVVVKILMIGIKEKMLFKIEDSECIPHYLSSGKTGYIEVSSGSLPSITKGKNGNLVVVAASQ